MTTFKSEFNAELIEAFAVCIKRSEISFDSQNFKEAILPTLEQLELKDRSNLIAEALHSCLPPEPDERERILFSILHPLDWDEGPRESSVNGITSWGTLPMTTLVGKYGLGSFDRSMNALKVMTTHFSSEFAIRFLILQDSKRAFEIFESWLVDPNHHVRRLVSEGTRPRLPWAMQLPSFIQDPKPLLPLLSALREDESEYVRRSVANNLNDIAKDHPDLVANIAVDWMKDAQSKDLHPSKSKNLEKLIRHACRTLIKQGHSVALSAFGIQQPRLCNVRLAVVTSEVKYGDALEFELVLASELTEDQKLVIDYVMHFKKANGTNSPKVFKWTTKTLPGNGSLTICRKHSIKPITTRKYYEGEHYINVRINGQDFPTLSFHLLMS